MTRPLPGLADVLAVLSPTAEAAERSREAVVRADVFDVVWAPHERWTLATRQYAGSEPDGADVRRAGLAFADGRDRVDRGWADLAALARTPGRLAEIPGDLGCVSVDRDGAATVARSPSGRVPFYIARGGGAITIATSLKLLVRFHGTHLELDPLMNAAWASRAYPTVGRRTFLRGVEALRPGEHARLDPLRVSFGRHWDPRSDRRPHVSTEHPDRLRALLLETLDRELATDGTNLVTLSGGVDSASVTALGAGVLGRATTSLTALSPFERLREVDLRYIGALAAEVPLKRGAEVVYDDELRLEALDEPAVPFHVPQPFLCLLRRAVAEHQPKVIYGGEFVDNVFGSKLTRFDWARHTTPFDLYRQRGELPMGWVSARKWLSYWARRPLGRALVPFPATLSPLVRPELRGEYEEWYRGKRRQASRDGRPLPYASMLFDQHDYLGMHWELTSDLGLRRCHPFVTREILELAFECHPHELVGRQTKRILRTALVRDVPAFNLQRPDKGTLGAPHRRPDRRWTLDLPAELDAVLPDGYPPRNAPIPYSEVLGLRQLRAFVNALRSVPRTS